MIYNKISPDGTRWGPGLGTPIPQERGAPYILRLSSGQLILTSNNHHVLISNNNGESWSPVSDAFPGGPKNAFFSSIYEFQPGQILLMTGEKREPRVDGGLRFGRANSYRVPGALIEAHAL